MILICSVWAFKALEEISDVVCWELLMAGWESVCRLSRASVAVIHTHALVVG